MTHGISLIERLEALVEAANEPPPKPLPDQDSRAGEAMAGIEDQRRYRSWQDRVLTARAEITEIVPEAAALIREYEKALQEISDIDPLLPPNGPPSDPGYGFRAAKYIARGALRAKASQ